MDIILRNFHFFSLRNFAHKLFNVFNAATATHLLPITHSFGKSLMFIIGNYSLPVFIVRYEREKTVYFAFIHGQQQPASSFSDVDSLFMHESTGSILFDD